MLRMSLTSCLRRGYFWQDKGAFAWLRETTGTAGGDEGRAEVAMQSLCPLGKGGASAPPSRGPEPKARTPCPPAWVLVADPVAGTCRSAAETLT